MGPAGLLALRPLGTLGLGRSGQNPDHGGPTGLRKVTCHPGKPGQSVALCLGFCKWPPRGELLPAWGPGQLSELRDVICPPGLVTSSLRREPLPSLGLSFLITEIRGWDQDEKSASSLGLERGLSGVPPHRVEQEWGRGACFKEEGLPPVTSHAHSASKKRVGAVGVQRARGVRRGVKKPVEKSGITQRQPVSGDSQYPAHRGFRMQDCCPHAGGV